MSQLCFTKLIKKFRKLLLQRRVNLKITIEVYNEHEIGGRFKKQETRHKAQERFQLQGTRRDSVRRKALATKAKGGW